MGRVQLLIEMSAIFGELITFSQENGPDVQLKVFGDEFYARYETKDGYTVIYDHDIGRFTYALLEEGLFVSSGVCLDQDPPDGMTHHIEESIDAISVKAKNRFSRRQYK
jgi:hypothetical protein